METQHLSKYLNGINISWVFDHLSHKCLNSRYCRELSLSWDQGLFWLSASQNHHQLRALWHPVGKIHIGCEDFLQYHIDKPLSWGHCLIKDMGTAHFCRCIIHNRIRICPLMHGEVETLKKEADDYQIGELHDMTWLSVISNSGIITWRTFRCVTKWKIVRIMWRILMHITEWRPTERWGLVCIERQGLGGIDRIIAMWQSFRDIELKQVPLIPLRIVPLLGIPIFPNIWTAWVCLRPHFTGKLFVSLSQIQTVGPEHVGSGWLTCARLLLEIISCSYSSTVQK